MSAQLTPDEAAELADCFRCHFRELFGYACLITRGDRPLADDLVQDVFQAAANAWPSLRDLRESNPQKLLAWLRSTLHHKAVDVFRRNELARLKLPDIESRYKRADTDTYRDAINSLTLERCWQVISEMPNRRHLIAVMHWRAGMMPNEIATVLGISASTVSVQLHHARQKLTAEISEHDPPGQDDTRKPTRHHEEGGAAP